MDAGFRPVEIGRAKTSWLDLENGLFRIPKEESSKNTDNWVVALSSRTVRALERWMEERQYYEKYQDNDKLWLTREGNPYNSNTLAYVLKRLCEIAGIDYENREMSWYTIRHSVGTQISREEGLGAAQAQLRHKDQRTTMRYDQAPVENRQEALKRMG
jgi:integrase